MSGYSEYNRYHYNRKEEMYLFLTVIGSVFVVKCLAIAGHDIYSVIQVFRNMFPTDCPLGVFKVSRLEAHLLAKNFQSHCLTVEHFSQYQQTQQQNSLIFYANGDGYTNVYLDEENGKYSATASKTGHYFGVVVNQKYLQIINLFFNGRENKPIITGFGAINAANAGANASNDSASLGAIPATANVAQYTKGIQL